MKRSEIWTIAGGSDYAGKPRPAVVVQDDRFENIESATVCFLTSNSTESSLIRPVVEPDAANGLRATSRLMADKITTVPKTKLGKRVGTLADEDMARLNRAMIVFLGIAMPLRPRRRKIP